MPSTYTHYKFGLEVLSMLSDTALSEVIKNNMELFLTGLHGPDILFYYGALESNPVNTVGYALHEQPANIFFENGKDVILGSQQPEKGMAYMLGYICHFSLDSECHSYIEHIINTTDLKHTEIETDFERQLMTEDGIDPVKYNTASHIHPSVGMALVIASFYMGINSREIEKSLQEMKRYNQLLLPVNPMKRIAILSVLKLTGNYSEMHGLVIKRTPDIRCADSSRALELRYEKAKKLAVRLMNNYDAYVNDSAGLMKRFKRTFGPDVIEMSRFEERAHV